MTRPFSRRGRMVALASVVLGFLACSRSGPSGDVPRRVILISIDTLRADHLGFYRYARLTSPILDALAASGVVFEDVTSPSPWTLPAHASMLTGLYPNRHGLKSHERYLPSDIPTIALLLGRNDWATAAAVNSHNLGPEFGLDRGFQQYLYVEETAGQVEPTRRVTDQAIEWLRQPQEKPLFIFMHYYDVHTDYRSLSRYEQDFVTSYAGAADGTTAQLIAFREGKVSLGPEDAVHLVDLYDAGVRQMDEEIGRFVSFLKDEGLWEGTLLIVTSDHGEEFLEHGDVLHGRTQFQEAIRVPLLFVGASVAGPRHVQNPVSLVDLAPTILGVLGIEPPADLDGVDLAAWLEGRDSDMEPRFLFGEADHNNQEHDITRSVRQGKWKLHFNRLTEERSLYDLARDPGEQVNRIASDGEEAERLMSELRRFMERGTEEAPTRVLSPEEIEKLRSLGYVR